MQFDYICEIRSDLKSLGGKRMNTNERGLKAAIITLVILVSICAGIASCNENSSVHIDPTRAIVSPDDFESYDIEKYPSPGKTTIYESISVTSKEDKAKEQPKGTIKKYLSSTLAFLTIGICVYIVFKRKLERSDRNVDTFWVTLLGFSLILIIFSTFLIWYFLYRSLADYQSSFPGMSQIDALHIKAAGEIALLIFILPLIASFIVWYVIPPFIKRWNALEPLPSKYKYVHDLVQKIASKMGIPPPSVLYTHKDITNCFNLGKREGESALVISNWLLTHLNPDELEAVLAHEMAHTKNRDVTLMAYFAVTRRILFFFPVLILSIFLYSFLQFGYPNFPGVLSPTFWGPFMIFFALYSSLVLGIQWFSRLREVTADARASLFVDKTILKRVLYKFASARSIRIPFVSSSLMMSDNRRFGSIFSTHPPIHKRYKMLDQKKYIIDYEKPPSLKFCFITALSIYIFLQLINYIFSALVLGITGDLPQAVLLYFFNPIIVATLLILYHDYLSHKYLGMIILLIAFLQFIVFMVLGVPSFLFAKYILLPASGPIPSGMNNTLSYVVDLAENFSETIKMFLLTDVLLFSIITFLLIILLGYGRKAIRKRM